MSKTKVKDFTDEIARYEEMKEYFSVNFETGLVTRIKNFSGKGGSKIGDVMTCKNGRGYIQFNFKSKSLLAHRFIFYCYHNELYPIIDHKDTIITNNWISNLRAATHQQNMQNQNKPQRNNTTGYLGVSFRKDKQKYEAQIGINGKIKRLGFYQTAELASEAYLKVKREIHDFCTI